MFQAHSKKARNLSLSKRATREAITAETLDLSRLLAIYREMFNKLVLLDRELSMTVAELFEDIGNCDSIYQTRSVVDKPQTYYSRLKSRLNQHYNLILTFKFMFLSNQGLAWLNNSRNKSATALTGLNSSLSLIATKCNPTDTQQSKSAGQRSARLLCNLRAGRFPCPT